MKLGIAISTYCNTPEQLARCMDSVTRAAGPNDRIVLSMSRPSHEVYMVSRHYNVESRHYNDCLGPAGDWNRAVEPLLEDCDYITMVHADDTVCSHEPNHFGALKYFIGGHDICYASLRMVEPYYMRLGYAVKRRSPSLLWRRREFITDPNVTAESLINRNTLTAFAMIRSEVWRSLGGYRECCDWDFNIRALQSGCSITACPVPTYNYTVHSYDPGVMQRIYEQIHREYGH